MDCEQVLKFSCELGFLFVKNRNTRWTQVLYILSYNHVGRVYENSKDIGIIYNADRHIL